MMYTTVIMNNRYALPYLMPGKNTVSLTAAEGTDLARNKLTLEYAWLDAENEQSLVRTVDRLPFEYTVDVQQRDVPKMKFVKLSVAPQTTLVCTGGQSDDPMAMA